ncbi:GpE family phage tail protein [Cardiobacterium hominis]|uniref:GpE family phage tail protein n=1 Tax=Cardiobacterium hominis TaxID=2718 RepID=UPI000F1DCF1A|nr:GpE family phage tail protein [Cardiobacterium hominis]RKW11977.1 MAG: GpE family phage tail protein [Cardiobacterium sp.]
MPVSVEEAWADINIVFGGGWPPSEMDRMSIRELLRWHTIARERNAREQAAINDARR